MPEECFIDSSGSYDTLGSNDSSCSDGSNGCSGSNGSGHSVGSSGTNGFSGCNGSIGLMVMKVLKQYRLFTQPFVPIPHPNSLCYAILDLMDYAHKVYLL